MHHRNEINWIKYIKNLFVEEGQTKNPFIGDDCAVISIDNKKRYFVTSDMLIENVHFSRAYFRFDELAKRALAVNLSDIAAMGGVPQYIILDLGIPEYVEDTNLEQFFSALKKYCDRFKVQLIGGDLNRSPGPIIISITVLGFSQNENYLLRSGACEGDFLYVSGTLGDSRLGFEMLKGKHREIKLSTGIHKQDTTHNHYEYLISRHKTPDPRIPEGLLLSKHKLANSCIDISDGLTTDLKRLCNESNVGCNVWLDNIPINEAVKQIASIFNLDPLELALSGGEDFELLFTINPKNQGILETEFGKLGTIVTQIGEIVNVENGVKFLDAQGIPVKVPEGYLHF